MCRSLTEVQQAQTKTKQTVNELLKKQLEDRRTIQDSNMKLHEIRQTRQETNSKVEEIHQTYGKEKDLEGQREKHRESEILKKLANIDSLEKNGRRHADSYTEGTRLSIIATVESWLNDRSCPNRVMVISGNPGMGKSVISAVM